MNFTFTEDHEMFRDSVRGLLDRICTPETLRALWETETGRSFELWSKVAELGVFGLMVPESSGGLEMNEIDLVLPLIETGYAAFPGPIVECAAVAVPLMSDLDDATLNEAWLPRVANGEAIAGVGHQRNPFVADAHVADLLLLQHGDEVHAVERERVTATPSADQRSQPSPVPRRVEPRGEHAGRQRRTRSTSFSSDAFDRGAFACAAQLLGVAQRMVDIAVLYATQREQFGKADRLLSGD